MIIGGVVLCLIAVVLYLVGHYGDFAGLSLSALYSTTALCTMVGVMLLAYGIDKKRKKNPDNDLGSGSTSMLGLGSINADSVPVGAATPPVSEILQKATNEQPKDSQSAASGPRVETASAVHAEGDIKKIIDVRFEQWNFNTARELEILAFKLPIIQEKSAEMFFQECNKATGSTNAPSTRTSGNVFATLKGFISACERHDLKVDCLLKSGHLAHGIMIVESFDTIMGALFAVARISERSFLFLPIIGEREKRAIKSLVGTTGIAGFERGGKP